MTGSQVSRFCGFVGLLVCVATSAGSAPIDTGTDPTTGVLEICVFELKTGRRLQNSTISIFQSNDVWLSFTTGIENCAQMSFSSEHFRGHFLQAQHEHRGRVYTEQLLLPNRLPPQRFRYDLHLDIPRYPL
jgi:hypothetical protein